MYYTAKSPEDLAKFIREEQGVREKYGQADLQLQVAIANTDFWLPIEADKLLQIAEVHGTERMRADIIVDGYRFYWLPREGK